MILVWLPHVLLDGGDGWQNPLLHSEITSLFFYSENLDSETQNNMEYVQWKFIGILCESVSL